MAATATRTVFIAPPRAGQTCRGRGPAAGRRAAGATAAGENGGGVAESARRGRGAPAMTNARATLVPERVANTDHGPVFRLPDPPPSPPSRPGRPAAAGHATVSGCPRGGVGATSPVTAAGPRRNRGRRPPRPSPTFPFHPPGNEPAGTRVGRQLTGIPRRGKGPDPENPASGSSIAPRSCHPRPKRTAAAAHPAAARRRRSFSATPSPAGGKRTATSRGRPRASSRRSPA